VSISNYRAALRTPGVTRVLVSSLVARAPQGMSSLAILLLISRHSGYGRAGVAVGVMVACTGVSNPLLSRLAGFVGARRVLVPAAVGNAVAMSALVLVPSSSYAALVACCALTGLATPPVVAVVRGLWPRLFAADEIQALYGLEATAQELIFIIGPALVAVIAAAGGPVVAVLVTAALALAGTLVLAASPQFADRPALGQRQRHRVLARLPVFLALACTLTVGFNMCDIAIVAFVSGRHANAASGAVLAVWSAGSMFGGLLFAGRAAGNDETGVARGCAAIGVGLAAAAAAPERIGLAVILFVGAMVIAPGLARLYGTVATIVPEAGATEAFAWIGVGLLAGASAGAAIGGITVDALGPRATFLLAGVLPVVGAVALMLRRRSVGEQPNAHPLPS
jgi:MFS family permease